MKKILLSIMIVLFCAGVSAIENLHFYPVLDYADETDVSGGGVVTYLFRNPEADKELPPSRLYGKLKAGLKGNLDFKAEYERQLESGKYFFNGSVYFNDYGYSYAGLGNEIEDFSKDIECERLNYRFSISRRWDAYIFGFTFTGRHFRNLEPLDFVINDQIYNLKGGGWSTGPGLVLEYDTRDNHYFPQKGAYISLAMQNYSIPLGSDYQFDSIKLRATAFQKIIPMLVIAGKLNMNFNKGDVPFHELADLNDEIRGFSQGLLKDDYLTSASLEIRSFPFNKPYLQRLGFAVFGECGEVNDSIELFRFDELHYSWGLGLRYMLNKDELYTIRFDYGMSKEKSSMDFSSREAF